MKAKDVPPPEIVATPEALHALVAQLAQEPRVALDTESNSLYAYHERTCLIQISIPDRNFLVDPLSLDDLAPLGAIMADPQIEKVFHAADYDLIVLRRDFGFSCANLFDTMWAARVLGWPRVGLASILGEKFGVTVNKKFQRYDWGKRPLSPEALRYAWMDSYYLLPLRDMQQRELAARGRWEEAQEIFAYLSQHVVTAKNTGHAHFWRIKGRRELNRSEQQVLYRLYLWREKAAAKLDVPTVKVLHDEKLVQLAQVQPRSMPALTRLGLSSYQVRRFGRAILQALKAPAVPLPPRPASPPPPPEDVQERFDSLKVWRKSVAARRGVAPDVILPNVALWAIAKHPPRTLDDLLQVPGIGPWRQQTYGPDLLRLMSA